VCPQLYYWYNLKSTGGKRELKLRTLLSGEELVVETIPLISKQEGAVAHPHEFMFVINNGEARVEVTDIGNDQDYIHSSHWKWYLPYHQFCFDPKECLVAQYAPSQVLVS
jgi:hypothetical protein